MAWSKSQYRNNGSTSTYRGRNRTQKQRLDLMETLMRQMGAQSKIDLLHRIDEMVDYLSASPLKYTDMAKQVSGKSFSDYMDWLKEVRREVARA